MKAPQSDPLFSLRRLQRPVLLTAFVGALGLVAAGGKQDGLKNFGPTDPTDGCIKCHKQEVASWKKTTHFSSLDELENDRAYEIAEAMGWEEPVEEALCQSCHVTKHYDVPEPDEDPLAGVSCESCHGASEHWKEEHNKTASGATLKPEEETPDQRLERLARSQAQGMIHPDEIYPIATNCFSCHTVPQEELINTGGHTAGSEGFDLLAWSQGEVRHSFVGGGTNGDPPIERKRLLYIVGKIVDLEYSLRALGKASGEGDFATAMIQRIESARGDLMKIQGALGDAAPANMKDVLDSVTGSAVEAGNGSASLSGAEAVAALGKGFQAAVEGKDLSGVDSLLPKDVVGTVFSD